MRARTVLSVLAPAVVAAVLAGPAQAQSSGIPVDPGGDRRNALFETADACALGNLTSCRIYSRIASTVTLPKEYAAFAAFARVATTPLDPGGAPADPLSVAVSQR